MANAALLPLSPALQTTWTAFLDDLDRNPPKWLYDQHRTRIIDDEFRARLLAQLTGAAPCRGELHGYPLDRLGSLTLHPDLHPTHLARLLCQFGVSHSRWGLATLLHQFRLGHPKTTLLELADELERLAVPRETIATAFLHKGHFETMWPTETGRTYWLEQRRLVRQCLRLDPANYLGEEVVLRTIALVGTIPELLDEAAEILWEYALGSTRRFRREAQQALAAQAEPTRAKVEASLQAGSAAVREQAAEWLGRWRLPASEAALRAAWKREKVESVRAALLQTLDALGLPLAEFITRADQAKEAAKILARGIPEELAWFPFARLPALHWADGAEVDPTITQAWIVQSHKARQPAPGALLRRLAVEVGPTEREAFGRFVLDAWLAYDLEPVGAAEAEARAQQDARAMVSLAQWMAQNPTPGAPPVPPESEEQWYARLLPRWLRQPLRSGIGAKGVLAVAGAFGGSLVVEPVRQYLKDWYGLRAAQCRALLQMLGWVDEPTAVQLLLSVSSRFRTKGIQEEAHLQVEALAARKGWTRDELTDRTVPTLGLDQTGTLELDYGPRRFVARLDARLQLTLTDPEGRVLSALPEPRQTDDADLAGASRKHWSAVRKQLKEFAKAQTQRLFEAMCAQRRWPLSDWQTYLWRHPILRHLVTSLVWAVPGPDGQEHGFRPLGDGTLSSVDDSALELAPGSEIVLAHGSQLPTAQSAAWRAHLADYEVVPLFPQFEHPAVKLADRDLHADRWNEFEGHLLENFKLRSAAAKHGFQRARIVDGPIYTEYLRSFPGLGLEAVLNFSGSDMPETNRLVALGGLSFQRSGEGATLPLSEVPAVLLAECRGALQRIAAVGTGFDPDWEKKVENWS